MARINSTEQWSRKNDGRKTTNDALITLLRAGVIASMMMLVLGAGMIVRPTLVSAGEDVACYRPIPQSNSCD